MRTNFAFVVLLTFLTSIQALSQDQVYYWSSGKKNFLEVDKTSLLALPDKEADFTKLKSSINATGNHYQFSESTSHKYLHIASKEAINLSTVKEAHKVKFLSYGFRASKESTPMFLTGEILLQPKANVDIEDVLSLIDGEYLSHEVRKYGLYKLIVEDQDKAYTISNQIYESGMVNYCHPNFIAPIQRNQMIPTDPFFGDQYYLDQTNDIDINAPQAWAVSTGINTVRVAVIDDGVEAHEDLAGRVVAGFSPRNPNGFGAPTVNLPLAWTGVTIGHGQACAGIIGATHNNVGVAGVFPGTEIVPVNIFEDWTTAGGSFSWIITPMEIAIAIDSAWDDGQADVLSNSWGYVNQGDNFDEITLAINRARTQGRGGLGSVVVFASGNEHGSFSGVPFPANVPGVLTVGAISRNGGIHGYSSRGAEMDLVAPSGPTSGDLVTTDRMGTLGYNNGTNPNYTFTFNGTSAACPQVAGVAALMLSVRPDLTEADVRSILQNTATDMGSNGFDNTFGFGRLNAQAAMQAVIQTIFGSNRVCTSNQTFTINAPVGSNIAWSVSPEHLFGVDFGSGSSFTTRATNSTTSGNGTIRATITGNAGTETFTKNVWVGSPSFDSGDQLYVQGFYGQDPITLASGSAYRFQISTAGGSSSYNWNLPSGFSIASGSSSSSVIDLWTSNNSGNYTFTVRSQNSCGLSSSSRSLDIIIPGLGEVVVDLHQVVQILLAVFLMRSTMESILALLVFLKLFIRTSTETSSLVALKINQPPISIH